MDSLTISSLVDASRSVATLSVEEMSALLENEGLPVSVADTFEGERSFFLVLNIITVFFNTNWFMYNKLVIQHIANEIDGRDFLELTENDVKELVKPLGQVKKIIRLQKTLSVPEQVWSKTFIY